MERLSIQPNGVGQSWYVWPITEPIPPGVVEEAGEHIIELTDSDGADTAELSVEGVPLRALRSADRRSARWAWEPGFNAGRAEATLRVGARRVNLVLETDPSARKLAREEFDGMVGEILQDSMALLSIGGHRKGFGSEAGRPPPLARLEYLCSRVEAIISVVNAINVRPRRALIAEDVVVPYWKARGATGTEILRSFRSGRVVHDTNNPSILPPQLRGMMPATVRRSSRTSSVDLPEHRVIRSCLSHWSAWLSSVADSIATVSIGDHDAISRRTGWASRMRATGRKLAALLDLPLFEGVRDAAARIQATPLFRHDPAYRAFYRLAQEMELATTNLFGDFLDLPIARTFDLYELWCFLRLARVAADAYGVPIDLVNLFKPAAGGIEFVSGAASVRIGSMTISFQRSFREFWAASPSVGSFSREMVPDVTIAIDGARKIVALDAKYRIAQGLNDALSSAHMYRDAIVEPSPDGQISSAIAGAFLLTPHRPKLAVDWERAPMPERLFHREYQERFGLGAWSLRPGEADAEILSVLAISRALIEASG